MSRRSVHPCKFLQRPEDGIRTAGVQGGVKRKVGMRWELTSSTQEPPQK